MQSIVNHCYRGIRLKCILLKPSIILQLQKGKGPLLKRLGAYALLPLLTYEDRIINLSNPGLHCLQGLISLPTIYDIP